MSSGSFGAVYILVVDSQGIAVGVVSHIHSHIRSTHGTGNGCQVSGVACDGGRVNRVCNTIFNCFSMSSGGFGAVFILVVDGQSVAVGVVCHIHSYICSTHCAFYHKLVSSVASKNGRGD